MYVDSHSLGQLALASKRTASIINLYFCLGVRPSFSPAFSEIFQFLLEENQWITVKKNFAVALVM